MSVLVAHCPRCDSVNMTFDVKHQLQIGIQYQWQHWVELYAVCRNCHRGTAFIAVQKHLDYEKLFTKAGALVEHRGSLNEFLKIERYVSLRDEAAQVPPEHVPEPIAAAFREAATCLAVQCWNAAGAMFRLCIDLATRPLLPQEETAGLSQKTRRDLGLRLPWLFDNKRLLEDLRPLSTAIREDGNDGAHTGTLTKEDAQDLLDFTQALLERMYTEPARLRLAQERRDARRQGRS